jgi:hypothetical protein
MVSRRIIRHKKKEPIDLWAIDWSTQEKEAKERKDGR